MEDNNLEEWQKDLIRNGEYDITNFEEDLGEDVYYSKDEQ